MPAFVVRPLTGPALAFFLFVDLSLGACDCQKDEPAAQASEQARATEPSAAEGEREEAQDTDTGDAGSASAAGGPRSSQPKSGNETCRAICDTALKADCPSYPRAQCLAECLQMTGLGMCEVEMEALLGCWATTAPEDFKCDDEGKATTRKGVCADEQTAASECMAVHMAGKGMPSP